MVETGLTPLTARLRVADVAAEIAAPGGSAGALLARLLDRAAAVEPAIRSLVPEPDRDARLRAAAAALEARWPDPAARPPLFGVPVGVKDIVAVDGLETRCGSAVPPEAFAMPQAEAVTRLLDAGAVVFAKTVTTEFAYFDPGPTVNPRAPGHTPGGSSSGSAAAVAAGIVPLALGTQTVGSVIRPAAFCGIVGVKPTYGRIPTTGVLPYSPAVDTLGVLAQDVAGARAALAALCDGWSDGAVAAGERGGAGATPPTLAVPVGPCLEQVEPDALARFERTVDALVAAGWSVLRVPALADLPAIAERHRRMIAVEFAREHAERFARWGGLFRPMSAMQMDAAAAIDDATYRAGLAGRATLAGALEAQMSAEGIDAWICPSATGPAPAGLTSTGSPAMNLPWTHAGMPAVTLPAGHVADGRPLGVQAVARRGRDEALLGWAAMLERALAATDG